MKFRKKPVVIDAMLWNGRDDETGIKVALDFIDVDCLPHAPDDPHIATGIGFTPADGKLYIPTLEGTMCASPGDWIIKGVKGEFYPCKPDIFAATYEDASSPSPAPEVMGTPAGRAELEAAAEDGLLVSWDKDYKFPFSQVVRLMAAFAIEHRGSQPDPWVDVKVGELDALVDRICDTQQRGRHRRSHVRVEIRRFVEKHFSKSAPPETRATEGK